MNKKEFNELYETLKKSKFRQQKFPGWRPLPTISCITIIFISGGVFFIIVGILILIFIGQLKEVKYRYDSEVQQPGNYIFNIPIPERMKKPIMIYYQINDFRQNHRFYMENKSDKQLKGEEVSKEDLEKSNTCENYLYNKDFGLTNPPEDDVAFPCGAIARTFMFSDKLLNISSSLKQINVTTEEIAYKSDRDTFSKIEKIDSHWLDVNDENFMIWSRISPFENPRKLWGIIKEDDLEGGTSISVNLTIKHLNFEKYIIFSTRNVFGGKNTFLGICYIVFGSICLISAVIFINVFNYFHKKPKN